MKLFTSFRLPADDWVSSCNESWRAAGFDMVTVDGPGGGKPRIGDILSAIRKSGAPYAGIINGDCKLTGTFAAQPNPHECIACWRVDADTGKPARYGFDAFFFDTSIIPVVDCGFSIGDPWWDIWFPWACRNSGAHIYVPRTSSLSHKAHPMNWSRAKWVENGRRFWATTGRQGIPTVADLYKLALSLPHEFRGSKPSAPEVIGNRLRGWLMPLYHRALQLRA